MPLYATEIERLTRLPCSRFELLENWLVARRAAMPSAEERALKETYLAQIDRQRARARHAAAVEDREEKKRRIRDAEAQLKSAGWDPSAGPVPQWVRLTVLGTPYIGEPEDPRPSSAVRSLGTLPRSILLHIFEFVPVVSPTLFDDVRHLVDIMSIDDACVVVDAARFTHLLEQVESVFTEHSAAYAHAAVACLPLGLEARDELVAHQFKIRTNHGQLQEYLRRLRAARREVNFARRRAGQLQQWSAFRDAMLNESCTSLRPHIRPDLIEWCRVIRNWLDERRDVVGLSLDAELRCLTTRVRAVEFIGNPDIELEDVRNMLWEVHIQIPCDVTREYPRSITFGQALTLGITDVPWVRGYVWEARDSDDYWKNASTLEAATTAIDEAGHAVVDSADNKEVEERERAEVERKRQQWLAARELAASGMTRRILKSNDPQSWTRRRMGGCDLCAVVPIHIVGLKRDGAATDEDIVLCAKCFSEQYQHVRVIRSMWSWFVVKDLIDAASPGSPLHDGGIATFDPFMT